MTRPDLLGLRAALARVLAQYDGEFLSHDDIIEILVTALYGQGHEVYLSTGCLHNQHGHCCGASSVDGLPKVPGRCKFCDSRCVCLCHEVAESVSEV